MTAWTLADLVEPVEPGPADWNDDGVVIVRGLAPESLIAAYERAWLDEHGPEPPPRARSPLGWRDATPYMRVPALRDLCCCWPLAHALADVLGEPAAVHLNLTGWVSTERNWHQDGYLNPPGVGDRYAAVWIALGPIDPDSGPFQYVPGSHRWHRLTRDRMLAALAPDERATGDWPKHSERVLNALYDHEILRRGAEVREFVAGRGDVLIWHPRLLHRGSPPRRPGAWRPGLIAHYSAVSARPDMPPAVEHPLGGWYFPLGPAPF